MPRRRPANSLPARPWIRDDVPWAWRGEGILQVGDGERAVVLTGLARSAAEWLSSLRGDRRLPVALEAAERAGLPRPRAERLLRALLPTGALDDAAVIPQTLRGLHPLLCDQFSQDLAAGRHVHGSPDSAAQAIDLRRRATVAVVGDGPTADLTCLMLTHAGIGEVLRESPGSSSSRRQRRRSRSRALAVLAGAAHPDVLDDLGAISLDLAHLPVTVYGARATIGPLVLPGLTGCLQCADLRRRDADAAWPRVAVQLAHRRPARPPVDSALAQLAAAWIAQQAVAWIEADGPAALDAGRWPQGWPQRGPACLGTRLTVSLPNGSATAEPMPAHPLCGCRWPAAS